MQKLVCFIFYLSILSTANSQEYITNTNLKYHKTVKKVQVVDSLNGDIQIYQFNEDGLLELCLSKTDQYEHKESISYEGLKIKVRKDYFKNKYANKVKTETFIYDGDRLVTFKYIDEGKDEIGEDYRYICNEKYKYDDKNRIKKKSAIYNFGRTEIEEYFYNESSGLIRTRHVVDDGESIDVLAKEYKNDTIVTIESYSGSIMMTSKDVKIYNSKNQLLEHFRFGYGEEKEFLMSEEKNNYENNILVSTQIKYIDGPNEIYFYNERGDVVKSESAGHEITHLYEYNKLGDIMIEKIYSGSKLINIKKYEYLYRL
mgnify:CR=1 FL=1